MIFNSTILLATKKHPIFMADLLHICFERILENEWNILIIILNLLILPTMTVQGLETSEFSQKYNVTPPWTSLTLSS